MEPRQCQGHADSGSETARSSDGRPRDSGLTKQPDPGAPSPIPIFPRYPDADWHCHLGFGKLYTGKREQAQEHLTIATAMHSAAKHLRSKSSVPAAGGNSWFCVR